MPRGADIRRLLLLRHAHAEPAGESVEDVDRPLSARGRSEALEAAECIAAGHLRCDLLLSSPALRARQTATIVAAELDFPQRPAIDADLYPGEPAAILRALGRCAERYRSVLIVAHNPGISELAQRFHGGKPAVALGTAGLCLIELPADASWQELKPRSTRRFTVLR
jgi:phosphohistidine phosphatase